MTPKLSVNEAIMNFLWTKGAEGATMADIYAAVRAAQQKTTPDTSIRSVVYKRLANSKSAYIARFRRIEVRGEIRYSLL